MEEKLAISTVTIIDIIENNTKNIGINSLLKIVIRYLAIKIKYLC